MRLSASLPLAVLAFSALAFSTQSQSAAQTVAATPPMGWNSWNYFAERVTDKDIRASADQIVSSGMKDSVPSSHLTASSTPTTWMSDGFIAVGSTGGGTPPASPG